MTDTITPALSAEEWAQEPRSGVVLPMADITIPRHGLPRFIALANRALPDDDPRKITPRMLEALSFAHASSTYDNWAGIELAKLYAAIESILPPL